jgi:uncharacterized repeat protein (TIGR03803 family)
MTTLPNRICSLLMLAFLMVSPSMVSSGEALRFNVLHTFSGGADGGSPVAALIGDMQGNLYGTAGTVVFKVDKTGAETVLHTGFGSMGSLVRDSAGNLYGTTYLGGDLNLGAVFEVDADNNARVLHSFGRGKDGRYPAAGLILDQAGDLCGTTSGGGVHSAGTVFKLTRSRGEIVLHSFAGPDGSNPYANLIGDTNGNLYGTTEFGGPSGNGVVFRLDSVGRETVLYSFTGGADGSRPAAGLVRDQDGNLYGTTVAGGAHSVGAVFELNKHLKESVLHSFAGADGVEPSSQLVRDAQGNLYGTTLDGGPSDTGTLFKVDGRGVFSVLHNFDGTHDGYFLPTGVFRDHLGKLYGVAELGGRFGFGTVYELTL